MLATTSTLVDFQICMFWIFFGYPAQRLSNFLTIIPGFLLGQMDADCRKEYWPVSEMIMKTNASMPVVFRLDLQGLCRALRSSSAGLGHEGKKGWLFYWNWGLHLAILAYPCISWLCMIIYMIVLPPIHMEDYESLVAIPISTKQIQAV